ncbi:MAG: hypothetical protein ACFFA0_09785 [Promethearchaeota archaeon]
MSKIFICRECGYAFPSELSNLIEQNIQVYCEKCGSPFILEGVKFKPAPTPLIRNFSRSDILSESDTSKIEKLIQVLNKISFLPIFIFTVISFGLMVEVIFNWDKWSFILFNRFLLGLIGVFLLVYDRVYIAPKVKEKKFNEIFIDSICWGILGCILFGTGVIILIKGAFIFIYVIVDRENKNLKGYDYGLLAKNSLNYLSSKAGYVILLIGIYRAYADRIYLPRSDSVVITFPYSIEIPVAMLIYLGFLILAFIALILDGSLKKGIKRKNKFKLKDSIKLILIALMGIAFFASTIFILLKGILLFFLSVSKPPDIIQITPLEEKEVFIQPDYARIKSSEEIDIKDTKEEPKEPIIEPTPDKIIPREPEIISEQKIITKQDFGKVEELEEIPTKEAKEEEFELRLHESLLPVKDEKDQKLVKEYFSRIFSLLSKDLRQQINNLKISKKEKRELLQELAFLTKEEQVKYIEALSDLYKEIPKKLIERIRKLPNVKPKHINNLVDQLKYMDTQEQAKFIQFLEENA